MTLAELKAVSEEAHERGRKVRGHIGSKRGILAGREANLDVIDHAEWSRRAWQRVGPFLFCRQDFARSVPTTDVAHPDTPRASRTALPIGTNGFPSGVGALNIRL